MKWPSDVSHGLTKFIMSPSPGWAVEVVCDVTDWHPCLAVLHFSPVQLACISSFGNIL